MCFQRKLDVTKINIYIYTHIYLRSNIFALRSFLNFTLWLTGIRLCNTIKHWRKTKYFAIKFCISQRASYFIFQLFFFSLLRGIYKNSPCRNFAINADSLLWLPGNRNKNRHQCLCDFTELFIEITKNKHKMCLKLIFLIYYINSSKLKLFKSLKK